MGALFTLLRDYTGLGQTWIGSAVELGQGQFSEIASGPRTIAATMSSNASPTDATMPDQARLHLGLSLRHSRVWLVYLAGEHRVAAECLPVTKCCVGGTVTVSSTQHFEGELP